MVDRRKITLDVPLHERNGRSRRPVTFPCRPEQACALALLEARQYAEELGRSPWDFAVEIDALRAAGATNSALRWLVCSGHVEHGRETTLLGDVARTFRRSQGLRFTDKTCFVLTEAGIKSARGFLEKFKPEDDGDEVEPTELVPVPNLAPKPTWDWERQELRVGDVVVKQFKVPAAN